jgi:transcriptional regulator with XRE-family HTH domain
MKKSRPANPRSSNAIDQHFGGKIRESRHGVGMSQDRLGRELGISFQQIQKYESGRNRISAARLYEICQVFNVPIASMFEGIPSAPRPAVKVAAKREPASRRTKK